jgi:uncharacterized protein
VTIRFDDLQALGALVSADFGAYGEPIVVTQAMIDAFAELTGDRQWIHVDVERARREGPFGGTVAHGYLVLGLLTALAPRGEEISGFASAINYGLDEVRFVSPVPAGSAVHARRRIAHVRKKGPNGTQITFENEIRVVGAERPAVICKSIALFLG